MVALLSLRPMRGGGEMAVHRLRAPPCAPSCHSPRRCVAPHRSVHTRRCGTMRGGESKRSGARPRSRGRRTGSESTGCARSRLRAVWRESGPCEVERLRRINKGVESMEARLSTLLSVCHIHAPPLPSRIQRARPRPSRTRTPRSRAAPLHAARRAGCRGEANPPGRPWILTLHSEGVRDG
eukprot:scaffold3808_cov112-Isochrysis_galbana.AAC.51